MKVAKGVVEEVCGGVYVLINGVTTVDWSLTVGMFAKQSFMTDLLRFELEKLKDKTVEFVRTIVTKYTIEEARSAFAPLEKFFTW